LALTHKKPPAADETTGEFDILGSILSINNLTFLPRSVKVFLLCQITATLGALKNHVAQT